MILCSRAIGTSLSYWKPKSHEILMFVCLQKDHKQCCDATKLDCTHCAGHCAGQRQHKYNQTLWHRSIVWHLFGDTNIKISRDLGALVNNYCKYCIMILFSR